MGGADRVLLRYVVRTTIPSESRIGSFTAADPTNPRPASFLARSLHPIPGRDTLRLVGRYLVLALRLDRLPARVDWSFGIPRWVRLCMLAILAAGIVYLFYQYIVRRWAVRWSDHALALLIERKIPDL